MEKVKGLKHLATGRDGASGGEHTTEYTGVLRSRAPGTHTTLLTDAAKYT